MNEGVVWTRQAIGQNDVSVSAKGVMIANFMTRNTVGFTPATALALLDFLLQHQQMLQEASEQQMKQ